MTPYFVNRWTHIIIEDRIIYLPKCSSYQSALWNIVLEKWFLYCYGYIFLKDDSLFQRRHEAVIFLKRGQVTTTWNLFKTCDIFHNCNLSLQLNIHCCLFLIFSRKAWFVYVILVHCIRNASITHGCRVQVIENNYFGQGDEPVSSV